MRYLLRSWVPFWVRQRLCVWKKNVEDHSKGIQFATRDTGKLSFKAILIREQVILPSRNYSQKVHNFRLAIEQIHTVVINPNEVFSFNEVVGEGCLKRGYQQSRSLCNGVLKKTYGGGLCQLAGLIYQVSLQLGLDIVERYNHSIDIYTDENRYTDLGSDATISYPFKDLRIRNNSLVSFRFRFHIMDHKLLLTVESTGSVPVHKIVYQVVQKAPQKVVHTKNHHNEIVAISVYDNFV